MLCLWLAGECSCICLVTSVLLALGNHIQVCVGDMSPCSQITLPNGFFNKPMQVFHVNRWSSMSRHCFPKQLTDGFHLSGEISTCQFWGFMIIQAFVGMDWKPSHVIDQQNFKVSKSLHSHPHHSNLNFASRRQSTCKQADGNKVSLSSRNRTNEIVIYFTCFMKQHYVNKHPLGLFVKILL